jgi:hypothetical protein
MPEFLETWTLRKITQAGNHKPVPITLGHYMGETDLLASPTRAAESLAPGVWDQLQAVRRRYDPQGVFYGHIGQA